MRPTVLILLALGAPLATAPFAQAQHAEHHAHHAAAAPDSLDVPTGLSAAEAAGLLAGAGLGLAKPAELHGYPGPLHVLELADALGLSAAQRVGAEAFRADMLAQAIPLGEQIVQAERHLDAAFAGGAVSRAEVERMTAHAARLRGELRAVHLTTHLVMRELMTAEQIARYAELRGSTDPSSAPSSHGHDGGHR